jgi:hypothetical protein
MMIIFAYIRAFVWKVGSRLLTHTQYGPIVVATFYPDEKDEQLALKTIISALAEIRALSPARARRVEKRLKLIVNVRSHNLATYFPVGKMCSIDIPKISGFFPVGLKYGVALSILHEAFHAWLFARGFPYNETNKDRIERLCRREERMFLRKVLNVDDAIAASKYLERLRDVSRVATPQERKTSTRSYRD